MPSKLDRGRKEINAPDFGFQQHDPNRAWTPAQVGAVDAFVELMEANARNDVAKARQAGRRLRAYGWSCVPVGAIGGGR